MIRLSLIVPIYKAEAYVQDCVASITRQLVPGVEVILVNDGSPDRSAEIARSACGELIARGVVTVIDQPNQGVSVARNTGLARASGTYVGFIDADDLLLSGYVESVLAVLEQDAVDIVEFGYKSFSQLQDLPHVPALYLHGSFGRGSCRDRDLQVFARSAWYPWSRVFRRALFEGLQFPPGVRFCEDLMTLPFLYERAVISHHIRQPLYAYRTNVAGATSNVSADYSDALRSFFRSLIPRREFRFALLKVAVLFALYSCALKSGRSLELDATFRSELRRLRLQFGIYWFARGRPLAVLLAPHLMLAIAGHRRRANPAGAAR